MKAPNAVLEAVVGLLMCIAILGHLFGCETQRPLSSPDAGAIDQYCERYQSAPAPCYADVCESGERVCGNERICQYWEDSDAYQCRVLYWCDCE